ncbi:MAG: glyoxalase [Betaproteobacteria bacterium]|nr:glyoxalase [Betaproteobacteria bacterium]
MSILGIDCITHGVEDIALCRRFFLDWGLALAGENAHGLDFETLNGCQVKIRHKDDASLPPPMEPGATLREVIWGVQSGADIDMLTGALARAPGFAAQDGQVRCIDPTGLGIAFRVTRKRNLDVKGMPLNTWDTAGRGVNVVGKIYERGQPIEVGHVVLFTDRLADMETFYRSIGYCVSDRYPGRGLFLRCAAEGGHHDLFLLQLPTGKKGLNHVAYAVRDVHEVFGGGLHITRCGWDTELGPGRHPISSAYFWYVKSPAGGLAEYYTDEDMLDANWQPREFESKPEAFAEWAIFGGIDGVTRRQKSGPAGVQEAAKTTAGQAAR